MKKPGDLVLKGPFVALLDSGLDCREMVSPLINGSVGTGGRALNGVKLELTLAVFGNLSSYLGSSSSFMLLPWLCLLRVSLAVLRGFKSLTGSLRRVGLSRKLFL